MPAPSPLPPTDKTQEAKESLKRLHESANRNDLDGVVAETAEDIVVMLPGSEFVRGTADFRKLYGGLLDAVTFKISEDISEATLEGNDVYLLWVTVGSQIIKANNQEVPVRNNAMGLYRPNKEGKMKLARVSFAPATS